MVCASDPVESRFPLPPVASYNFTPNVSLPTGALIVALQVVVQFTVAAFVPLTAIDADFVDEETYAGRCALAGAGVGMAIVNVTFALCGAF
jgi:hypothetical protein